MVMCDIFKQFCPFLVATTKNMLFSKIFRFSVEHASIRNNGIFKPNPYVELLVDNSSPRKTETVKHTYQPTWNESFTICVTPTSELSFRLLDRSNFLKDSLLGERIVHLAQILEQYHGRCDNLELVLDLLGTLKPEGRMKTGELVVVFDGLKVESAANGVANGNQVSTTSPAAPTNIPVEGSRRSVISAGIRTRIRMRTTPANTINGHAPVAGTSLSADAAYTVRLVMCGYKLCWC